MGCIMLDSQFSMTRVVDRVKKDDFYEVRNQEIYGVMVDLWEAQTEIDLISLSEGLRKRRKLAAVGNLSRLSEMEQATPSSSNVEYYVDILKEKSSLRNLIYTCSEVAEEAREFDGHNVAEFLGSVEQRVLSVANKDSKRGLGIKDIVLQTIEDMDQALVDGGGQSGLESHFSDLDHWTGGLHPGELMIVSARPAVGKTSFCMNIAERAAVRSKVPVGIFSLEMNAKSLVQRMESSLASVDSSKFKRGGMTEGDIKSVSDAASKLAASPLHIDDDSNIGVLEIRARSRRMKQDHGIKLILIDYFQLIQNGKRRERRYDDLAENSHALKAMAKELNLPVILVSQMNREFEKETREPRLSDLRECGDLEQDADTIVFLWTPKKPSPNGLPLGTTLVHAKIAKQRHGPTAKFNLKFVKPYTRFECFSGIDAIEHRADEPET